MSYSHADVKRRFERGETTGKGHNMAIVQHNDYTLLVGYGHAVYAVRTPRGRIVRFDGWKNQAVSGRNYRDSRSFAGSTSTKQHPVPSGDVRVAYRGGHTYLEDQLREKADIVTGVDRYAAPQVSDDWLGLVHDVLAEADEDDEHEAAVTDFAEA